MPGIRSRFTSLGYTTRKTYRKITTAKPSVFLVASIVAGASIFLLGGGIYDILEQPLIGIPLGRRILFFYPGTLSEQTILDSVYAMLSYFFGVVGILVMYQSTKYAYRPRQAFMLLLVGAMFFLLAYFLMENLVYQKLTTSQQG
ncbi:MAG TPA: hypothetical protein VJ249_02350 [Candidatus Bathyarchaeia archaeon]|nr:hypothetical protein [Candidatus Bathyarchaeia archaeon]